MTSPLTHPESKEDDFAALMLGWYDRHARDLPWRVSPKQVAAGARQDPYLVWLSEIMLQQTTVGAVRPYFRAFAEKWPTVEDLAAAPVDDVMKAWAGLGYYSRARNLKKCAEAVVAQHGGRFPDTEAGLRTLPGIGAYTAAATAAIAYGRPAAVVDGNVERVVTRYVAIRTPLPEAKPLVGAFVSSVLPADRPGDFAQAMMDLGATICTPKRPACVLCPLRDGCRALKEGEPELFPVKAAKKVKPKRVGAAFVAVRRDGAVLLRKRPDTGLLGGMAEVPGTAWTARIDGATGVEAAPFRANWRSKGSIGHVFTHFELELSVFLAFVDAPPPPGHWWSPRIEIHGEALPTVMKKVIEAAIEGATRKPVTK